MRRVQLWTLGHVSIYLSFSVNNTANLSLAVAGPFLPSPSPEPLPHPLINHVPCQLLTSCLKYGFCRACKGSAPAMAGKSGLGVLDVNHGVEYTKGSDCFHAHHMVWVLDCMIMT